MRVRSAVGAILVAAAAVRAGETTQVKTYPSGFKWIHRPVTHNRIMAFQLFIPGGWALEPETQAGVTHLMTSAMVKGTQSRSALQLAQEMEMLGASFGIDAQPDHLSVGGQVTVDKWLPTFDLFEDVLLRPSFPEAEVDKERAALLNAIHTKDEHIFTVAEELFRKNMFGAHPYGRPEEGSVESVTALTSSQIKDWHQRRTSPAGAVLVTVGNVSRAALAKRVDRLAQNWSPAAVPPDEKLPAVVYPTHSLSSQASGKFEQAYLMIGYPAPGVGGAEYPTMKLLNALLGGGMSSPLFTVVREEGSLAYEVSSFYPSRRGGSSFVVYAGMDPKNLTLAEEKVRSVLKDFASHPPTARDLDDAKTYLRGHYLMDHQTNGRLAHYLGWWEMLGKGFSYDSVYPGDILRVHPQEVHELARKTLAQPSVTVHVVAK